MSTVLSSILASFPELLTHLLSPANAPLPSPTIAPPPAPVSPPPVTTPTNTDQRMDVSNVLVNPTFQKRPSFYDTPVELGPSIVLPFQYVLHKHLGQPHLTNIDLAAEPNLKKLAAPYGFAKFETLEVLVFPGYASAKYAFSVEVRFLPSDLTPDSTDMLNHPGAVSISGGGPIGILSNSSVPCDLSTFSPVFKSPFLPTDRIRVAVHHCENCASVEDGYHLAKKACKESPSPLCTTVLRGTVRLAHPSYF